MRGDATHGIPGGLEWQRANDVVNAAAHLLDAPAAPGPELRRDEVKDRDAAGLGPLRQPPVKAGVVDQDDGVRAMIAEVIVSLADETQERAQRANRAGDEHHWKCGEREEQTAASSSELGPTESGARQPGVAVLQGSQEVAGVQIATGLAGADEDVHGKHPCFGSASSCLAASGAWRPKRARV